jgi:site-specific DNA-methyltransferase (adenine-specific)
MPMPPWRWERIMSLYYEDEFVQLHHGDCRELEAWKRADVLVTDPPYGISWQQSFGANQHKQRVPVTVVKDVIKNDDSPDARDSVLAAWGQKPAIVFGSWRIPRPADTRHTLIWHKLGAYAGVRSGHPFISNHEEIYVIGSGWINTGKPLYSVMTTTEPRHVAVQQIGHPTPKPVGLMEKLLDRCPPEWVIADPFAGSGSTLIAARNIGRRAIGVEIEEKYCELIVKRLGQQAFQFEGLES